MKQKVYLETTIPSYLTAWPSRDLIKAAQQQITHEWWQIRDRFDLYVSQIVIQEASKGNAEAAAKRMSVLQNIPAVIVTQEAKILAIALVEEGPLPDKAVVDALHIAISVISGMDYILTWNCTHIANAAMRQNIEAVCRLKGYEPPIICTPTELMEV